VPAGESEYIHRVLSEKGVRCELVVYEDEGHGIQKLPNRIDVFERVAAFLDEVLG
jgi:dipeptidyl aminopeptidase/acylaminoacyl peptidase